MNSTTTTPATSVLLNTKVIPSIPQSRRCSLNLSRDQKLQILTLYGAGHGPASISKQLDLSIHQVRYTVSKVFTLPKKNKGRSPKLNDAQVDELEEFVRFTRETRQMSYLEISANFSVWIVGEIAIKNAVEKRGYSRCLAGQKPPISESNRAIRKSWAENHLPWTEEDWALILWSDKSFINDVSSLRKYVTRMIGDDHDDNCVSDRYRMNNSWIFWGCFSGSEKGPCIFWEKDWGNITAESYPRHI